MESATTKSVALFNYIIHIQLNGTEGWAPVPYNDLGFVPRNSNRVNYQTSLVKKKTSEIKMPYSILGQ
jgi:hypothetical protein